MIGQPNTTRKKWQRWDSLPDYAQIEAQKDRAMPYAQIMEEEDHNLAAFAFVSLDERERYCITERFYTNRTLAEIGKHLGLTRERIRQIILKALRKIRHKARIKHLI